MSDLDDRWMDKEAVVHVHNGILLSYKKEHVWVSSDEVNEPRTYYTELSKSEEEIEMYSLNKAIKIKQSRNGKESQELGGCVPKKITFEQRREGTDYLDI